MSKKKIVTKAINVALSDEERHALGDQLAAQQVNVDTLMAKKGAMLSGINAEITEAKKGVTRLAKAIVTGQLEQQVECEEIQVFATNEVQLKRVDNGEVVDTRAMTAAERQTEMYVAPDGAEGLELEGDATKPARPTKRKAAEATDAH